MSKQDRDRETEVSEAQYLATQEFAADVVKPQLGALMLDIAERQLVEIGDGRFSNITVALAIMQECLVMAAHCAAPVIADADFCGMAAEALKHAKEVLDAKSKQKPEG